MMTYCRKCLVFTYFGHANFPPITIFVVISTPNYLQVLLKETKYFIFACSNPSEVIEVSAQNRNRFTAE